MVAAVVDSVKLLARLGLRGTSGGVNTMLVSITDIGRFSSEGKARST
jgi:hypothetical protein